MDSSTSGSRGQKLRIAVLISGSGSNLQALIDAIEGEQLPGVEIVLVISNKARAQGLQRALQHNLPAIFIPWQRREEAEKRAAILLQTFEADLIVLAGFMRILSEQFIHQFAGRIINLHPSLLPDPNQECYITNDGKSIPALRGMHVVQQAIDAGLPCTGSSVHYVVPEVDAGPVIGRVEVAIKPDDTAEALQERIKEEEHRLIVTVVRDYANQAYQTTENAIYQ